MPRDLPLYRILKAPRHECMGQGEGRGTCAYQLEDLVAKMETV